MQTDLYKGPYFSGVAEYWMRNIPIKYMNEIEFADADCLLSNISIAINKDFWFALTYIYLPDKSSSLIREIALSLTSKKLAKKYYTLFDAEKIDDMIERINNLQSYTDKNEIRLAYNGSFDTIPLLTNYIKKDDLESKN